MKEKGIVPGRLWIEKPVFMSCTGTVIDAFVPPEGPLYIFTNHLPLISSLEKF